MRARADRAPDQGGVHPAIRFRLRRREADSIRVQPDHQEPRRTLNGYLDWVRYEGSKEEDEAPWITCFIYEHAGPRGPEAQDQEMLIFPTKEYGLKRLGT